jgi:hypothetical protein
LYLKAKKKESFMQRKIPASIDSEAQFSLLNEKGEEIKPCGKTEGNKVIDYDLKNIEMQSTARRACPPGTSPTINPLTGEWECR